MIKNKKKKRFHHEVWGGDGGVVSESPNPTSKKFFCLHREDILNISGKKENDAMRGGGGDVGFGGKG